MEHTTNRRMPAEWEPYNWVMMAWPHEQTDWAPMLMEARKCFADIAWAVVKSGLKVLIVSSPTTDVKADLGGISLSQYRITEMPTNDTWTRDYGPLTVELTEGEKVETRLLDFKFNGWGLKFAADCDNLVNHRLALRRMFQARYEQHLDWVLEGGSIDSDGRGTLLTTSRCLLSPNRNGRQSRASVEEVLRSTLGAQRVLWLDHGALEGDDTDSHIDTLARFAPDNTILYVKAYNHSDRHSAELEAMEEELKGFRTPQGQPYNLIGLPLPEAIFAPDGERLPATYANFLITPYTIILPTYRQPKLDEMAAQMLRIAFPNHQIIPVDCLPLLRQHGSLHCSTMQLP